MPDTIKERLNRGEFVRILGISRVLHHNIIQILGINGGFHGVWFDLEHVGNAFENIEIATIAARASGLDSFVRLPPTDYAIVTRCLEAGASGVMAAQIQDAAHAIEFVSWTRFHPDGTRGLNSGGWDAQYSTIPLPEFCRSANANRFVAIQIETLGALQECDAIAAIDGVDSLFIGPSDLSQNLGITGDFMNPRCIEAVEQVGAACRRHGKHLGAVSVSPDHARMLKNAGCNLFSPANDVRVINAGIAAIKETYSEFFD